MPSRNYQDLIAWQRAMDLVENVYRLTRELPKSEAFGLVLQMRRAATSIPSNIAEGQGRAGNAEFVRFLRIAYGSIRELETQAITCRRLRFLDDATIEVTLSLCGEVGRLINGLIKAKGA
jgi:four helix bundle protein